MLIGKGAWIWQIRATEGGNVGRIVARAKAAGLSHALVKVADGTDAYNENLVGPLAAALKAAGIQVWAWAWTYGGSIDNAAAEGAFHARRAVQAQANGFVIDAEKEYETAGSADWAAGYCRALRAGYRGPVALSSYWSPAFHPAIPWHTFSALVDFHMPQVYWMGRDAIKTLKQSLAELTPYGKPIFPTGAISAEESGGSTSKVRDFCAEVDRQGLPGANFLVWQEAIAANWEAMAEWKGPEEIMAHGLSSTHPLTEAVLRALGVTDGQVTQGWGTTVAASAGSHDPVGECPSGRRYGLCADLSYSLLSRPLFDRLAAHGICMFPRTRGENGWPDDDKHPSHIHCVHVGLRDHADVKRTVSLPLEQIDDWVRAHNGLISQVTLPVAWRPNAPQERFVADVQAAWRAPKRVTVLSPEGHVIPCVAVVARSITRCEVRAFCDYWEAGLTWAHGVLTVTTDGKQVDITRLVTVEGDIGRAGLRDLAAVIGLGIGEWQEGDYSCTVKLVYK